MNRNKRQEPTEDEEFEAFKQRLGDAAAQYTEAQLKQLQRDIHVMADLLLDFWLMTEEEKMVSSQPTEGQRL